MKDAVQQSSQTKDAIKEIQRLELEVKSKLPKLRFTRLEIQYSIVEGSFVYHNASFQHAALGGKQGQTYFYALKCIRRPAPDATAVNESVRKYEERDSIIEKRAIQLARETKILSHLDEHQNIRRLYAISSKLLSSSLLKSSGMGYFLVLDVIPETLRERLDCLRRRSRQQNWSDTGKFYFRSNKRLIADKEAFERAKHIGLAVARGMCFLHDRNIAYGDLSPDKVGFDLRGTIKLVDFTAAVELEVDGDQRGEFSSLQECSFASDVHSFGWLLWELLTLKKSYGHRASQVLNTKRTSLGKISNRLRDVMNQCWNCDSLNDCPTFRRILKRMLEVASEDSFKIDIPFPKGPE